jgi:hypothetical protein
MSTKAQSKREKFETLVERRMTNALQQIKLVGNLSNNSAYEWTDRDVKKIVKALDDAITELKQRFKNPKGTRRTEFKIGE